VTAEQATLALELLRRFVNEVDFSYWSSGGGEYCLFCDEPLEFKPHSDDCIYVMIKKLVKETK